MEPPVSLVLTEYVAPAPAATCAATASPVTVTEDVAPAPTVSYTTPVPVIEHMPTPVIEYIAPPPAEFLPSFYPSVSLPNEAIARLLNPQISISADETSQVQAVCTVCGAFVRKTPAVNMSNGERDFVVVWLRATQTREAFFVVSYAIKRWRNAWRWHVQRIMRFSVINVRKP